MADVIVPQRALPGSLILCLLVVTAAILTSCRPQFSSDRGLAETSVSQVDNLRADIQLLHRISNIGLSSGQIEDLIPVVKQLCSLKVQYEQRKNGVVAQMAPLLADKREMLISGQMSATAVDQRLLTPEQIDKLAGGRNAHAQARELLTWLREMPSSSYAEEAPVHAEMLAAPELDLAAEVLWGIFDTARNLSASEYASAQERLAERIAPLYGAGDEAQTRVIVETFSNGRMAALLREKADAMVK